jgi:hypothetical protein
MTSGRRTETEKETATGTATVIEIDPEIATVTTDIGTTEEGILTEMIGETIEGVLVPGNISRPLHLNLSPCQNSRRQHRLQRMRK